MTKLWAHQIKAVEYASARIGCMLAIKMGGGKSLATIATLEKVGAKRVLILSPLSVISTWAREFAQHADQKWHVAQLEDGSVSNRTARAALTAERAPAAVVINHESCWREPFKKFALATRWDAIVVDECHRAKAPGGRFSMFLAELRRKQPHTRRIGLTGTPMPHSPMDLYAQMRFVDPEIFGPSFVRFRSRYAIMGGFERRQVIGYQNESEMMDRFHSAALVMQEKDLIDLPGEVDSILDVELEPKAMKVYSEIENDFYARVESGEITVSNALVKLLRLQQITTGVLALDSGEKEEISTAKYQVLADLLSDVSGKVVVFGRFSHDLHVAALATARAQLRYGEVSGQRKDLDEGRYPEDIDVLGVQIQAGGVGIDLSRASLGVFLSTGFSLGDYLQARARLHRPGQKNRVTFLHVLARHTIDERVYKMLLHREATIASLLKRANEERRNGTRHNA